jgi:predicted GNAT family N-acyltransferase
MKVTTTKLSSPIYTQICKLRYKTFFKEHGLPFYIIFDEFENDSIHHVINDKNTLLAYGRLSEIQPGIFKISQLVVKQKYRKKGYGIKLMKKMIENTIRKSGRLIELEAQVDAVGFFQKFEFKTIGKEYPSRITGVFHIKMQRML